MSDWQHDQLAEDLAAHLKAPDRMVWLNMQLGPRGSPRPDVYTIYKSYVRPQPTAYEVKISREDFRSDITSGKWSTYLEYAHSVVFAIPAGLAHKDELPSMCGLIQRHENAWRLARKPTVNPRPIAEEALLKLLIDGVRREGPIQRAKNYELGQSEFARRFGTTAARYVADAASVMSTIERANDRARAIVERAERDAARIRGEAQEQAPVLWRDLCELLGLDKSADKWKIRHAIDRIRRDAGGGEYAAHLSAVLVALRDIVSKHEGVAA